MSWRELLDAGEVLYEAPERVVDGGGAVGGVGSSANGSNLTGDDDVGDVGEEEGVAESVDVAGLRMDEERRLPTTGVVIKPGGYFCVEGGGNCCCCCCCCCWWWWYWLLLSRRFACG